MKIFSKSFGLSWLATFLVIAIGNPLFHGVLAGAFVEEGIAAIGAAPMVEQRMPYIIFVWALIAFATAYFTLRDLPKNAQLKHAVMTGAFIGLVADGSWNFVNAALVPSYSISFAVGDTLWHVLHGALAGFVGLKVHTRIRK